MRQEDAAHKVIITAAVTGSGPTRQMHPALPVTPAEIAQAALDCWRAGAAVAHIHVRCPVTGEPSSDLSLFQEVVERVRSASDMLLNLTTSGLHIPGQGDEWIERRLAPLTLRPEIASLDIGSMNLGDRIFINPPGWAETAARRMRQWGVKPEIEIFDVGHLAQARELLKKGLLDEPPLFQLCMGVRGGIPATPENLLFLKGLLPANARWSALGVGRAQLPTAALAVLLGGGVRVGFEDNLYLREGQLARSNAELVETAVNLIHALQQDVASPQETRAILGIPR